MDTILQAAVEKGGGVLSNMVNPHPIFQQIRGYFSADK